MAFVRLDDLESSVEVVVVPAVLNEFRDVLKLDAIVLVVGRVDQKGEGETKIIAQAITALAVDPSAEEDRLLLRIPAHRLDAERLPQLRRLLVDHQGDAPVVMLMETDDGPLRYRFGDGYRVDPRDRSLQASLKTLFGESCLA